MKPAIGKSVIARALFLGLLAAATSGQEFPVRDWEVPAAELAKLGGSTVGLPAPFSAISPPCRLYDSRVSSGGPGPIPASGTRAFDFIPAGSPACGALPSNALALSLYHHRGQPAGSGFHLCVPDGHRAGHPDVDHQLQRDAGRAAQQRDDPGRQRRGQLHDRDGRSGHGHHHRHQRDFLFASGDSRLLPDRGQSRGRDHHGHELRLGGRYLRCLCFDRILGRCRVGGCLRYGGRQCAGHCVRWKVRQRQHGDRLSRRSWRTQTCRPGRCTVCSLITTARRSGAAGVWGRIGSNTFPASIRTVGVLGTSIDSGIFGTWRLRSRPEGQDRTNRIRGYAVCGSIPPGT